jgi:HNH endonuclease
MMKAATLTDDALTAELGRLAGREREATAALVVHLAEFDARRLYEGAGHPSMFSYCRAVLRLSEDAAYNRIKTARAARTYPAIVEMLTDGSLSPTTVRLLAPHLTIENGEALLAAAAGKGTEDVKELLAQRFPQPDVSPSVRKVPSRRVVVDTTAVAPVADTPKESSVAVDAPVPPSVRRPDAASPTAPPSKPPLVRPLAPARYEVRFTADAATRDLLREAQDLLGHAIPTGDIAAVFHRALTLLVTDLRRRKFGETSRPRPDHSTDVGSETSAAVRRAVSARDASRCAFVSKDGHRCGERRFLEFHHVVPRAAGGLATVDNIQLRCRAHNGYEVDLFFGPGKRRTKESIARMASPPAFRTADGGTRSGTGARPLLSG